MQPYGFEGAWQRLERAGEHLDEVRERAASYAAELRDVGDPVGGLYQGDPEAVLLRVVEIPERISIVGGELIYNLRASLDYLVFALSWHDVGRRPTGRTAASLQFPITFDRDKFYENAPRVLAGLVAENVVRVRRYQPFAGCEWIADLGQFSNEDKHRHPLWLVGRLSRDEAWEVRWRSRDGEIVPRSDLAAYDYHELLHEDVAHLEIALEDGRPLVATLERLAYEVAELLRDFAPDFNLEPIKDEWGRVGVASYAQPK